MPDHLCPYGLKAKDLLRRQGFEVQDHHLTTRAETEAFKQEQGVGTTPQAFIGGTRIGGYEALRAYFGKASEREEDTSYRPVIATFALAFLMAVAVNWQVFGTVFSLRMVEWFVAISMCILAFQKLQDIEGFSTMFLNYDLLAQRWVRYSYVYPYGEALAGLLMFAGVLIWIASPLALFIGTIGAVSVIKAVYIDKRALKCACVGGSSKVPLGFVSLSENLMMIAMAIWMPLRMFWYG